MPMSVPSRRGLPKNRDWPGTPGVTEASQSSALYGVTAVHFAADEIDQLMLGLIDPQTCTWAIEPAPARLIEVVDRLLGGDEVRMVQPLPAAGGRLKTGARLCVKVLESGAETLEAAQGEPASLLDLPRF